MSRPAPASSHFGKRDCRCAQLSRDRDRPTHQRTALASPRMASAQYLARYLSAGDDSGERRTKPKKKRPKAPHNATVGIIDEDADIWDSKKKDDGHQSDADLERLLGDNVLT